MKNNRTLKVVGSIALVGTLAAVAVLNINMPSDSATFFASKVDPEINTAFNSFISKYERSFLTKEEYKARLSLFQSTYQEIKEHNAKDESYKLGVNKFTDWSPQEIENFLSFKEPVDTEDDSTDDDQVAHEDDEQVNLLGAPSSIDWRQ